MNWDSALSCPAQGVGDSSSHLFSSLNVASAILLTKLGQENVDGLFFSNLSVGSSPAWYFHLTPFETLFLGLIIIQIFVLRYLEILPINVNNWFVGDPLGRKKRSVHKRSSGTTDQLAETTFAVLRRLDDQDCLLKSLCILQADHERKSSVLRIPKGIKTMVAALFMSGKRRRRTKNQFSTFDDNQLDHHQAQGGKRESIETFEDAVLTGSSISYLDILKSPHSNVTVDLCGPNYRACSVSSNDIIRYINIIADAGML